jgi:hypothetical protein
MILNSQQLERLKKLLIGVKPQGLVKRLKTDKELYEIIFSLKNQHQHDNFCETVYIILNNIIEKPKCQNCNGEKGEVKFTGLDYGYNPYCWKCGCILNMQKTIKEKYGVDNIAELQQTKDKKKQTCIEKYGVEHHSKLDSVKEKKKQTLLKNFGPEGLANPIIYEKRKQTCLERYGVEHHTQTKEVQDKKKETCQEKYGVNNVMFVDSIKQQVSNSWYNNNAPNFDEYVKRLIDERGFNLLSEYTSSHNKITIQCRKCQTSFDIIWNDFQQGQGTCPTCYPEHMGFSKQEEDIFNFLTNNGITNLEHRNKKLIYPFEIDIVDSEKKIGIEYCGLWFHSSGENSRGHHPKNYHLNKLNMCQNIGFKLITIFEDEWILKQDVVKNKLLLLFGIRSNFQKIHARKCCIKEIDYESKKKFLDLYHLQNDRISTINLGAFFEDKLLSVMTFLKTENDIWELTRYCCHPNYIIPGIFSKLLSQFKINYPYSEILTYADKRWSNGNVYLATGFQKISDTEPNYWYWGKGIVGRAHRLNFTKEKLKQFPNYDDTFTEFQLMALNKYSWIYDCGSIKFSLHK